VLDGLSASPDDNGKTERAVAADVIELCHRFPVYPELR
jgi:hypothetical protein